ncbi:MAG: FtsX-like permease family protein [Coriobacteriia bacterium]|nr:FtsX-like permease family protein [Coriobacteriia bacterium]
MRRRLVSTLTLKAWRDILAHKGQFISLIVLVSLGITSYVTFQNGYYDLAASLDQAYAQLRFADLTVRVERMPLAAAREIERISGVTAARVRTVRDVGLELSNGDQATARIVSTPGPSATVNATHVEQGRFPAPDSRDEVLLSPQFATDTGTTVGERLTLRISGERVLVRVVGIGTDPEYLYAMQSEGDLPSPGSFALVFTGERTVEHLLGSAGSGNDIAVRVRPGTDVDDIAERVEDRLRRYALISTALREDMPGHVGLQTELDQNRIMARSMPALVLVISSMSLFIALSRLVQAQRGEIGLAKALGYSDGQILTHYLTVATMVAAAGSLLGVGLGLWGAQGIAASYVALLGLPFLTSGFYPHVVAVAVGLAFVSCLAAAAVPAWSSARLAPSIAMHADPNRSLAGGRIPLLEKMLSPILPRSFTFRLPIRNLFRARRRSLYTVLGIAFAMVLSVTTVAMFDSIDYLMDKAFTDVERWDVMAAFSVPFGEARVAEVRRIDGVERVQKALIVPITLTARGVEKDVVLTAMSPDADFHGFTPAGGAEPAKALAAGDLVLAASTATQLGLAPGSSVSVDSPLIDDPVLMRVGSLSDEMLGQPAFMSFDAAAALIGSQVSEYNALYLDADPRRDERIQDELYDMPGAASVQVKAGLVERLKSLLELMDFFGSVLLMFGAALAFVVVFTTFTANVTERTREIATMRTIGEDNVRLAFMITLENLLLALAALPLGIWLGLKATDALFASFTTESYTLKAFIYPESIVKICLLMLAVLLLSEIPPVRRIFRLDLAESTKVME